MSYERESIAQTLLADGKGILAADETVPTLTRRFDTLGIQSTEQSRRTYREMLFTAPGVAEFISGVILQDETIRQQGSGGMPLAQVLSNQGILPGIKVDTGAKPLAGSPDETGTEGLDGLRERLSEYHGMGARFAKWRAVIHITDTLPSPACVSANPHALARYSALCQEQSLVPIVEPEVLMDGPHSIERFRIRRWRHGMGGTRTWRPARAPCPTGPAPTARRVSGNIRMRWKRHGATPMIYRIAETGATTDTTDRRQRNGWLDDTGFRGGDDGKRAG